MKCPANIQEIDQLLAQIEEAMPRRKQACEPIRSRLAAAEQKVWTLVAEREDLHRPDMGFDIRDDTMPRMPRVVVLGSAITRSEQAEDQVIRDAITVRDGLAGELRTLEDKVQSLRFTKEQLHFWRSNMLARQRRDQINDAAFSQLVS